VKNGLSVEIGHHAGEVVEAVVVVVENAVVAQIVSLTLTTRPFPPWDKETHRKRCLMFEATGNTDTVLNN
jgi:hypothetical protein